MKLYLNSPHAFMVRCIVNDRENITVQHNAGRGFSDVIYSTAYREGYDLTWTKASLTDFRRKKRNF